MNKKIMLIVTITGMALSFPAWSAGNGLISHKQNAAGVGLKLRPTELLIFGNPKLGTYFFLSNQTAGIDLPMKAMAWEDAKGQTWVAYNDPQYVADRHGITDRADIINKMKGALENFSNYAIAK